MDEEESTDTPSVSGSSPANTEAAITTNIEITTTDGAALAEDLLAKCRTLLNELENFGTFVVEQKLEQEPAVEIRKFQTSVATELKSLEKVSRPLSQSAVGSDSVINSLPAGRFGPDSREDHSYPPLLQFTVLLRHMGICES